MDRLGERLEAVVPYEEYARTMDEKEKHAAEIMLLPGMKLGIWCDPHESADDYNNNFHNEDLMEEALLWQLQRYYRGVMVGDWYELLEKKWKKIRANDRLAWLAIIWKKFLLYAIPGNHDEGIRKIKDEWLEGIDFVDCVVIKDRTGKVIADMSHGHEADVYNKGGKWTKVVNWLVRYVWTPVEWVVNAIRNPRKTIRRIINHEGHEEARRIREGSPARNSVKAGKLDSIFIRRGKDKDRWVLRGHTHKMMLLGLAWAGYANAGTCSGKNHATGLELECFMDGKIELRACWWDGEGRHVALVADM